jgi:hypothetical protein
MSARRLLLLSVALNLALLIVVAWFANKSKTPAAAPLVRSSPAPSPAADSPAGTPVTSASAPEINKPIQPFDWRLVESEDYKKYIANLRAIGCPEETIRDIISADVKKLFDARKRAATSTNKFEFWKNQNFFAGMMDEDKIKQSQELARERRALLKELLGTEPEEKPDLLGAMNPFETMLDFLSPSKQTEVAEIFQKYQAKMAKALSGGTPDAEDMKKLTGAYKEMDAELAKILTPQELEDYQLRLSQTAMSMRMQLASFNPNEQEFREIFKVKKKFDDEFGPYGMASQDSAEKEKYQTAKKEMDDQLKNLLGNRFEDYERSQDYNYQGMYRAAERSGLGKDAANKVYDMKKVAEEQANQVRKDKTLSTEQRSQALQGIRSETERSIQDVFGEKAWSSYQKQAYWLKSISPDQKPNKQ